MYLQRNVKVKDQSHTSHNLCVETDDKKANRHFSCCKNRCRKKESALDFFINTMFIEVFLKIPHT